MDEVLEPPIKSRRLNSPDSDDGKYNYRYLYLNYYYIEFITTNKRSKTEEKNKALKNAAKKMGLEYYYYYIIIIINNKYYS